MSRPRRYADWRPVAVRRMPAQWIGLLAGATVGTALAVGLHTTSQFVYWIGTGIAAFVTQKVSDRRLRELRDEEGDRQFAASLRLERETTYGHDEGLVSFEDGYLIYMGRRCAFSIGAGDVRLPLCGGKDLSFSFTGPGGKHKAYLQLKKCGAFEEAEGKWLRTRRRSQDSVLPPVVPDPQSPRVITAAMSVLVWIVLGIAVTAINSPGLNERHIPIMAASALLGFAFFLALYRYSALGWIARGERRPSSLKRRWHRWRRRRVSPPAAVPMASASVTEEPAEVRVRV